MQTNRQYSANNRSQSELMSTTCRSLCNWGLDSTSFQLVIFYLYYYIECRISLSDLWRSSWTLNVSTKYKFLSKWQQIHNKWQQFLQFLLIFHSSLPYYCKQNSCNCQLDLIQSQTDSRLMKDWFLFFIAILCPFCCRLFRNSSWLWVIADLFPSFKQPLKENKIAGL